MFGKFILLFLVWIGLTNSFDIQELGAGVVVSLIVVYFFTDNEKLNLSTMLRKYIKFIPIFLINLLKSNIEVARIVLSPKIKINPIIVKLNTKLGDDFDKLLLANSITLTPGTITVKLEEQDLYVHVLNPKTKDLQTLQKEIIEEFENVIKI